MEDGSHIVELTTEILENIWEKDTPPFENPCGATVKRCHVCGKWRSIRVMEKKYLMKRSHVWLCLRCEEELWPKT